MELFCIFSNMKVIYEIVCKPTNKKYIGSALNHTKRKREHFYNLKNNKHPNKKLQNAFNKYGYDYFEFNIIEIIDDENMLLEREQWYIDKLNPIYNICRVAGSSLGLKRSNETKNKIRLANLGIKHPKWRNEIKSESQGKEKHWTKKKKFSEESKKKMSETQKKLYQNGYIHPRKGIKETPEQIESKRIKKSKPVLQFTLEGILVEEFASAKEAHIKYGFSVKYIGLCCNGKIKKYKNYEWKFK